MRKIRRLWWHLTDYLKDLFMGFGLLIVGVLAVGALAGVESWLR